MRIKKIRNFASCAVVSIGLSLLAGTASAATETYQYFRFTQTALRGGGSENSIQLSEFEMRFEGEALAGAVATNPGGNSPAGEPPASAVDGDVNTKWLDFAKAPLVLDFGAPVTADGYRFATANDATERDPVSWTLEGSNDNSSWTLIHEQLDNPTTTLRKVFDYEFLFSNPPRIYQFERFYQIVWGGQEGEIDYDVEGATSINVQPDVGELTELESDVLYVTPPADTDTVYTMTATNSNGTSTASTVIRNVTQTERTYRYVRFTPIRLREDLPGYNTANSIQLTEFEFLFDGTPVIPVSATNPGGNTPAEQGPENLIDGDFTNKWLDFNKSNVIFDFGAPTKINGYRLVTGNDALERDPTAWLLEASDDQASWVLIDAIVNLASDPLVDFNYLLPDQRQTASDELPLPSTVSIGGASIGNFVASPRIVADGTNVDLSWVTAFADALTIDNGVGAVTGDSGTVSSLPPQNADTTFTLTVDNVLNQPATATSFVRSVPQVTAEYRYVRFSPLRLAEVLPDYGVANSIQLSEFSFYDDGTPLDLAALGTEASNPGGNYPAAEGPAQLIDGDVGTKWLDFNKRPVIFDFKSPQEFNGYQWTTANDFANRDPVAWRLDGSVDGVTWTVIDLVDKNRSEPSEDLALFHGLSRQTPTQIIPIPDGSSLGDIQPDIDYFIADTLQLISGEPVRLTWVSDFGTSATLNDGAGSVSVGLSDSISLSPTATTTYTLSVTGDGGVSEAQVTINVVTPENTELCYENFDIAGDEILLLGSADIVNDSINVPNPGDFDRLRITPIAGSVGGTAWFLKKVGTSIGFDTTFDLHFPSGGNGGADGMACIIQNNPEGTSLAPNSEGGLPSNALNITFDSFQNEGEASSAVVRVTANGEILAQTDLTTLGGLGITDLTQENASTPYRVQIGYTSSGLLGLYLNQTPVITDLAVDLAGIGAVDESGKAYVGFSARTGGLFEAHDVTSWCYAEGEPVFKGPIIIEDFVFDLTPGSESVSLTWTSSAGASYRIVAADSDLLDFTEVLQSGITSDGSSTSRAVFFVPTGSKKFVRVEEE
ncbi:discoidin domain-containing protein [Roseibacillus persicicus]|uniref:discoidin domain-containing protein n=1 Tax=Roseibacillus persicicus TaxID=454148 RepID=UPI00280D7745|nr:discoidin domain-containing protein [Roseibacillus persicicus]MDQ8190704.1 discoidin domain-containing protein [Roseibacillus persicicus]